MTYDKATREAIKATLTITECVVKICEYTDDLKNNPEMRTEETYEAIEHYALCIEILRSKL